EPVRERRLGEEGLAVHAWRHPVARLHHLARRLREHPLGVREAGPAEPPDEHAGRKDEHEEEPSSHAPRYAPAQSWNMRSVQSSFRWLATPRRWRSRSSETRDGSKRRW